MLQFGDRVICPYGEGGWRLMLAGGRVLQKEQFSFSRSLEVGILSLQNTSGSYSCVREVYMKHTNLNFSHKSNFQNFQCYNDVSAGIVLNMSSL